MATSQAQLAGLLSHIGTALDRYRAGEIDTHTVDETIHHYHRAATELWKFCFARGGGTRAEFIAGLLDRMTADAEAIDWWGTAPRRDDTDDHDRTALPSERRGCDRPWSHPQRLSVLSRRSVRRG